MWIIPDSNPEGQAFMAVLIVLLFFAFSIYGMRLFARWLKKASLDASDYCCLVGLILDVGLTVIQWAAFSHGWGEDITHFTLEDAHFAGWIFVAIEIIWNAACTAVRISMILLYIRIFATRIFRHICWCIIGINLATLVSIILATCLICRPITYSFEKLAPDGTCGDLASFELYTAIMSLLADLTVVVLPMPMLWRLQMGSRKKIELSIIFGIGAIICALTLARVLSSRLYLLDNFTKSAALTSFITGLEPTLGVIIACLPFMPPVVERVGQSKIFCSAQTSYINPFAKRNGGRKSKSKASSDFVRIKDASSPSKILHIVEMNPVKGSDGLGQSFVSTGSRNSPPESGPWDDLENFRHQDHIFVRSDLSIE